MITRTFLCLCLAVLGACASAPPQVPYPVFIQVDDAPNVFLASMPGVRAKLLGGDLQTRRTSNRIDLPAAWQGTSGGEPGRSMEIFVLQGRITLADIDLGPGGYVFLPAGSLGFNISADDGARILYFVNDADPESVIRAPIIIDAGLLEWQPDLVPGVWTRELRRDPGNGSATWLMRIDAGTELPWEKSATPREGYLVEGNYQHSECIGGEVVTGQYTAGGYFYRPANAINGGPLSGGTDDAVWFLRESAEGGNEIVRACEAQSQ